MSRIAPPGGSAVRYRVTSELGNDGKSKSDDRGRSRDTPRQTEASRVPEIPSIKQLRSRFQPDAPQNAAAVNLGKRATTIGTSDVPDIKVQALEEHESSESGEKGMNPEDPIRMEDPERYFESTNHIQRFQHTRALFAKMEEQTKLDQERRQQMFYRSKSPTRFPVNSPTSLAISPAASTGDANLISPTSSSDSEYRSPATNISRYGVRESRVERVRVSSASSASTDMREVKKVDATEPVRSSSVDRLDEDVPYKPSSLQQSAKFSSRSETDLGRSVRDSVPSPKWLIQHYEDGVKQKAALFGGQVPRRRTRPVENHVHSGPDGLHKDEVSKPPVAAKKTSSSSSQQDVEATLPGSSRVGQDYPNRNDAAKVVPVPANVTSRYGRPEQQPPTGTVLDKRIQSGNAAVTKPVVPKVESKGHDTEARPARRSTAHEDDSVTKSIEAWKTRRRDSNKSNELEKEHAQQTLDDKPSLVTDSHVNATNERAPSQVLQKENLETESSKPIVSEPSSTSTASKVVNQDVKPDCELETEVPNSVNSTSLEPVSTPHIEVNVLGQLAKPEEQVLTDLLTYDAGKDLGVEVRAGAADSSDRRLSLELAEVPHFPKDSIMMTGGHRSMSPLSSYDESHHPLPSFPDVKPDDQTEDLVFVRDHTHAEHSVDSDTKLDNSRVPLASTKPQSDGTVIPSVDEASG